MMERGFYELRSRLQLVVLIIIASYLWQCNSWAPSTLKYNPRLISSFKLHLSTLPKFDMNVPMDGKSKMMIDALRGRNLNDNDQQDAGVTMQFVRMQESADENDVLPLVYNPEQLRRYFQKRPKAIVTRLWQIVSASSAFFLKVLIDFLFGNAEDIEVKRAAELRNTIVSLGPFFIKLGQALSIRPDILSPRVMVELQQLCDKVPSFDTKLALQTIEQEFGKPVSELFYDMTSEPVAAASLGQVYKAKLVETNELVAVKVQRPFVLETVSLDLYLVREIGKFLRNFPAISNRLDIVSLLDEFANNFYQELDYRLECDNGLKIMEDMKKLPKVLIPKPFKDYCTRRVHTAQWVTGEKLSQSKADDVSSLVNLGVITYLTQLLDTGLFHADPHPGNMLRTEDGRLVILDFGLMTKITDDQKYGMIEAIAHLIHRDYDQIGNDFVNLDFIPRGTDTAPLIPALTRVFEAALAGGGAKSINFQDLASDLAEITFKFPFRIPPYFALIIRAISVLEGIALVGNPEFAIVDEAYPYISKRLLTDPTPRGREAFRYMVYGKSNSLDIERLVDILQAFEKFIAVKEFGDGTSFKIGGVRGNTYVGKAGDSVGTKALQTEEIYDVNPKQTIPINEESLREALKFFFSDEGDLLRAFMIDEIAKGFDAFSRESFRSFTNRLGLPFSNPVLDTLVPTLSKEELKTVNSTTRLLLFLSGNQDPDADKVVLKLLEGDSNTVRNTINNLLSSLQNEGSRQRLVKIFPFLQEYSSNIQDFASALARRVARKTSDRFIEASLDFIFGKAK